MAADEIRLLHEVRRANRPRAEPQVRDGDGARLLRVVHEVALREVLGLLADDLDRVLVGPDGAVGAKAEEDGALDVSRLDVQLHVVVERQVRDVVLDADREVAPRLRRRHLVVDGLDHRRREFLRREAVTTADDDRLGGERRTARGPRLVQGRDDVLVQRLADRARFLRAVQHRDALGGLRQGGEEVADRERAEEADAQHADAGALGVEPVHGFRHRIAAGAHDHDHLLRVRRAVVVEQPVLPADELREVVHRVLDDAGARVVEAVAGLARLEEGVGVLRRPADQRDDRG